MNSPNAARKPTEMAQSLSARGAGNERIQGALLRARAHTGAGGLAEGCFGDKPGAIQGRGQADRGDRRYGMSDWRRHINRQLACIVVHICIVTFMIS